MSGYIPSTVYGLGYHSTTLPPGAPGLGSEVVMGGAGDPYTGTGIARLVKAGASIAAGDGLKFSAADTVIPLASAGDVCVGVNDISGFSPTQAVGGVALSINEYFWMNTKGPCQINTAASLTLGQMLTANGTAGQVGAVAAPKSATTYQNTNIELMASSGGSGGVTAARIF